MKKTVITFLALVLLLATVTPLLTACGGGQDVYYVELNVKDYGRIVLELDAKVAPKTVNNFVSLVEDGFYDGLTFHRVQPGFMIQGGDPEADGSGKGPKTVFGEFENNGYTKNYISHTRGVISMARGNDMNSASCQFFICNADSTFLDGNYAGFGYVIEGMEVVDAITEGTSPFANESNMYIIPDKTKQAVIESARVLDNYK